MTANAKTRDDTLRCVDCGCKLPGVDAWEFLGEDPRCEDCDTALLAGEILAATDEAEFIELLSLEGRRRTYGTDNLADELIAEAYEAASRNDLDLARHRLRLCAFPKWSSKSECQAAYETAMKEHGERIA